MKSGEGISWGARCPPDLSDAVCKFGAIEHALDRINACKAVRVQTRVPESVQPATFQPGLQFEGQFRALASWIRARFESALSGARQQAKIDKAEAAINPQ